MDSVSDDLRLNPDSAEMERLRGELEQARVALEDMDHRVAELSASNAELHERLHREMRSREAAQRELEALQASQRAAAAEAAPDAVLREQLSTALEELYVMAEELSLAQDALRQTAAPP